SRRRWSRSKPFIPGRPRSSRTSWNEVWWMASSASEALWANVSATRSAESAVWSASPRSISSSTSNTGTSVAGLGLRVAGSMGRGQEQAGRLGIQFGVEQFADAFERFVHFAEKFIGGLELAGLGSFLQGGAELGKMARAEVARAAFEGVGSGGQLGEIRSAQR